jgi:hypothetical protein
VVNDYIQEEKGVLRWGGLAGVLGGLVFILVFVIVGVFAPPVAPEASVVRFPDVRAARTVENGLYLVALILWVAHFLALYRALRGTSLVPALFGSSLAVLGLVVLAAGALPHVATTPISNLYHAPGVTPEDQATLVIVWQATQGIFDALLFVGLVLLPIGVIGLGMAMRGTPAFGKRLGAVGIGLGAIGVVAATVVLIDPLSPIAAIGFFALIAFHLVTGWKVYSLSRTESILPRPGLVQADQSSI